MEWSKADQKWCLGISQYTSLGQCCSQSARAMSLCVRSMAFCRRPLAATEYCCERTRPMISQSLTYCRKNCTWTGSGGYSSGWPGSVSMKSSSVNISTSESSRLMWHGRPRATATDRSRVKRVHQIRFHSRLSDLLSWEPSTLRCMPEPWATMVATRVQ